MNARHLTAASGLLAIGGAAFGQQVVNIDFEGATVGNVAHVGADGALSTTGTFWNSIFVPTATTLDLDDEFGAGTPVDVYMDANAFPSTDPASTNDLQDSGIGSSFYIGGLLADQTYTVAGYVGPNGGFNVTDSTGNLGFQGFGDPGNPDYSLPGVQGNGGDYFVFNNVMPFDLGGGDYGFQVSPDGLITGFQISGVLPAPGTLGACAIGVPLALRRRRR